MLQCRHRFCLTLKAGAKIGVAKMRPQQHLYRNLAIKHRVVRLVNNRHTSTPKLFLNLISANIGWKRHNLKKTPGCKWVQLSQPANFQSYHELYSVAYLIVLLFQHDHNHFSAPRGERLG